MKKFEDIKRKKSIILIIEIDTNNIIAEINKNLSEELEKKEFNAKLERATTIRGIWDALKDEEKAYILKKSGYEF